jgi:POT family proton-dependent oligopeptide transporter
MSATATALPHDEMLGHPKGLFVCFLTEMWERFAFYGMKALLFLYLTKHHLFNDGDGYMLLGTYAGLAYALPLVGGMLADRYLGMRKAVLFGGLLLVLGQFGMAYIGDRATGTVDSATRDAFAIQTMYLSLALIAVGVGFLKPNISTIVGRLYPDRDPRRDSGFTVFYAGINLGAMLSSLVVGYIGINIGWGWGFGLSGLLMLFGLIQFLLGQSRLHGHAEPPDAARLREPVAAGLSREMLIYLGGLFATLLVWYVLQTKVEFAWLSAMLGGHEVTLTEVVAVALGIGLFVWFIQFLFSGITPVQRGQMTVLMVLIVVSALFWGLYEQTYGTWVAFTDRAMTTDLFPGVATAEGTPLPWSIGSLFVIPGAFLLAMRLSDGNPGSVAPRYLVAAAALLVLGFLLRDLLIVKQTAASLTFLGALFVVLLTPVFAALWPLLDRRGLNPSAPAKFGWGLIFAGLSFAVLLYASGAAGTGERVSVWWLVLAYLVLEVGEMVLSPIGLSVVTSLSVARVVGLMMGAWFLFSAFGEIIAGRFGTLAAMDPATPLPQAIEIYARTFELLMYVGVGAGVGMLVLTPLLNRLSRGQDAPATPHVAAPEPDAR